MRREKEGGGRREKEGRGRGRREEEGRGGKRKEKRGREGSLVSRPHQPHTKIRVYCHKSKSL